MVSFVHISDKNAEKAILRNGIKATKRSSGVRGVFAVPVVPQFPVTHQWARELKRSGVRTLICVQFRIPDEELVLIGKYNSEKLKMTAVEAAGCAINHTDPMGLEVIIPRNITSKEITRNYLAPKVTGWRFFPNAKGKPPFCHCKWCNRGEIRARRVIREGA